MPNGCESFFENDSQKFFMILLHARFRDLTFNASIFAMRYFDRFGVLYRFCRFSSVNLA